MRLSWMPVLLLSVVLAGCGARSGSAADAGPGAYTQVCESGATTFPTLDKSCAAASDCAIVNHTISCCGTQLAVGLAKDSVNAFDAAETKCAAGYPGCGCPQGPTQAEDGHTSADGTIMVECTNHRCTTYVP